MTVDSVTPAVATTATAEAPAAATRVAPAAAVGVGVPAAGGEEAPQAFVRRRVDFGFLPIPPHAQYDPHRPFVFTLLINSVMAAATTVMASSLYYAQPVLVDIAADFGVSYDDASRSLSLIQGGYCVGLAFIAPLADIVQRRQLLLALTACATLSTIGLALTKSWAVFQAMSFITGVFTVVPQVLNPLAADLAKPERRSAAVSIVISGLIGGMVVGRVVSGLFARFTDTYRNIYFFSIALQGCSFLMLWWFIPDYPKKQNKGLTYFGILRSMATFLVTEPALIQACLIGFLSMGIFVGWWTNLTFLLESDPYNLDAFHVGLFGLISLFTVFAAPRLGILTDRIHPWTATAIALCVQVTTTVIAITTANRSYGAVIVICILTDMSQQLQQIGNQTRVYKIHPLARGRLNGCYGIFVFLGQTLGSSAGSKVWLQYGWRAAYALSCAWSATAIAILLLRGPYAEYATGWLGWGGVHSIRKGVPKPGTNTELETGEEATRGDVTTAEQARAEAEVSKEDDEIATQVESESVTEPSTEDKVKAAE